MTGGSDGIGYAICQKLAREGFNICIIARNEDKMKSKLSDIQSLLKKENKQILTKYVVSEFDKINKID